MKKLLYLWMLLLLSFNASAGTLMRFWTTFGNIDVEMYEDKPVTVANFLRYVKSGYYQDTFLHRCIPGFIVQGGGYVANPGYSTDVSPPAVHITSFGNITNEFNVGQHLSNTFGTIAMAKLGGNANSASTEWFFNLGDNSANLDSQNGGFTVFGRVVGGAGVLTNFNSLNKANAYGLVDLTWWWGTNSSFGQLFSDLPVGYAGFIYPWYSDLIYVYDVSVIINVQVQTLTNHVRQISWNSFGNHTNYLEFTTNLPSATNIWQKLVVTNGTGATMSAVDPATDAPRRFYRVRGDF